MTGGGGQISQELWTKEIKKGACVERHDRNFPCGRMAHRRKKSGVAQELQRRPKKGGIFVDTDGRIRVSN